MRTRHLRLLPKVPLRRQPTAREVEVLLALVRYSTWEAAAPYLGLTPGSVRAREGALFCRIGARHRAHAVWMLSRTLGHRYVLPGDERRHHARRAS